MYVQYKRSRFSTRLRADRLYTPSHSWLMEQEAGVWRIGFTKFATRMLGEPVELDYEVELDGAVRKGEIVGWVEGFKAVTDLFCPMDGTFAGGNPDLSDDIAIVQTDSYGRGWLYAINGTRPDDAVDVNGYVNILDSTIDKMLETGG
jgi:glycine cleavage system H protein